VGRRPVGSLSTRRDFDQLRTPTARSTRGPIRVSFHPLSRSGDLSRPLVSFAITKACGTAVVRNRLRRRLQGLLERGAGPLEVGGYLIRPTPAAAEMSSAELERHLTAALAGLEGSR